MKYIVIKNNNVQEDEMIDDISDFLWNCGNEVVVKDNTESPLYDTKEDFDLVVLIISSEHSEKFVFETNTEVISEKFGLEECSQTKTILAFSKNGVFSDMIPFPHKLFHFEKLEQDDLVRFFTWCRKFNLFNKRST